MQRRSPLLGQRTIFGCLWERQLSPLLAQLAGFPARLRSIPFRRAPTALPAGPLHIGIQFSKFTAVGVIGTLGHYAVLVALVHFYAISPVLASSVGAVVGALLNYSLNYRFTFRSTAAHHITLPRFLFVTSLGFLINFLLMWMLVRTLSMHYILGQCVATIIVLLWNFSANRFWTFGRDL